MTKEDIKKALTCCSNPSISYCKDCPYANYGEFDCCNGKMCKDALNLITEQDKENKKLKEEIKQAQLSVLGKLWANISNSKQLIQSHIADGSFTIEDIYMEIDELMAEVQNGKDKD